MKKSASISISFIILFGWIASSIYNQWKWNIQPLSSNFHYLKTMLSLNETQQLQVLSPTIYPWVAQIQTYPPNSTFYFIPCFEDSGNTSLWWWYLCILTRYFAHPRKVLFLDYSLYQENKQIFIKKYIGNAKYYSELDWLKKHQVQYVILMRNNNIQILPIQSLIQL